MTTTKGEMDAHATKVQGGTQKIPGDNQGKISEGQAKVNAEATEGAGEGRAASGARSRAPRSGSPRSSRPRSSSSRKLLTDPGFWVSLVVAIALTAFVIATFGSGLAVLVVGGVIIGAISAGAGQITSNLAAGKQVERRPRHGDADRRRVGR